MKDKTRVAKDASLPRGKEEKLRKKPGSSSTGKYKDVPKKEFAGPAGGASDYSYPIDTLAHAKNALSRAHFAPNPEGIKKKVYEEYPVLKEHAEKKGTKNDQKHRHIR